MTTATTATQRPSPTLLSAYLGTFIALLDVMIVNVALPSISADSLDRRTDRRDM